MMSFVHTLNFYSRLQGIPSSSMALETEGKDNFRLPEDKVGMEINWTCMIYIYLNPYASTRLLMTLARRVKLFLQVLEIRGKGEE